METSQVADRARHAEAPVNAVMSARAWTPIVVTHLIRPYGVHGGERTLGALISRAATGLREQVVMLYGDETCAAHFARVQALRVTRLWRFNVRARSHLVVEVIILLALLPILQTVLLWQLVRSRTRICVVHGFQSAVVVWPMTWLLPGVRWVYCHHATKTRWRAQWLFRLLYRPFHLVAVSQAAGASVTRASGRADVVVIENGVDHEKLWRDAEFCASKDPAVVTVITVGRLIAVKGHDLVVEAFALAKQENARVRLWIVGDGPAGESLKHLVAAKGLRDSVTFLGYRTDVACLLRDADIFVLASESEGMSIAALEAMAMGLPSVVVDAPGVSECHEEGATAFVEPRDARALGTRLALLTGDTDLRARMGEQARRRARARFGIERTRQRYVDLYRELVG
jgi:glycosyltransferase involved in cell wall biosynthesis